MSHASQALEPALLCSHKNIYVKHRCCRKNNTMYGGAGGAGERGTVYHGTYFYFCFPRLGRVVTRLPYSAPPPRPPRNTFIHSFATQLFLAHQSVK